MERKRPYWQVAVSLMFSILATAAFIILGVKAIGFLMPFVVGWIISAIATPLVNWLEKRLKIVKKLGTAMIVIMVIGLIVLVGYFAVSRIAAEVTDLIQNFPDIYAQLEEGMREIGNTLSGAFSRLPRGVQNGWTTIVENLDTYMGNLVSKISEPTVTAAGNFAKRLPSKRKVIMVLPDPIIYKVYDGKGNGKGDPGSTVYWGELNGRKMDFSTAEDRIAAYKWYVDEVRRRFDLGNYQYIDLAGFYIISEELVTPGDGWNHELKKSDEIIPPLAEYLHAINQSLNWIPYNRAAGYKKWQQLGVDYAYMQPNYFWEGQKSLSQFFSDVKANGLGMEFEFDEALLEGNPDCDTYKKRFREYMSGARLNNVYGTKPLSYYHGTNALYDLSKSTAAKDREFYHEFCRFVLDNPMRK